MKAARASYSSALGALQSVKTSRAASASREELETINEILQRLRRLDNQVGELINTNNSFIEQRVPVTEFDPETDTATTRVGGIVVMKTKLKRADPNKPIQVRTLTAGGAYIAGPTHTEQDEKSLAEMRFEGVLEDYYQNAHKVSKLVQTLPGLENFECRAITIVRNKLIEHPEKGQSYSFGYGPTGPVIRPVGRSDREWIDAGLVPNTESFVEALTAALERQLGEC